MTKLAKQLIAKELFTTAAEVLVLNIEKTTWPVTDGNGLGDLRFEYFSGYKQVRYAFCKIAKSEAKVIVLVPLDSQCEVKQVAK